MSVNRKYDIYTYYNQGIDCLTNYINKDIMPLKKDFDRAFDNKKEDLSSIDEEQAKKIAQFDEQKKIIDEDFENNLAEMNEIIENSKCELESVINIINEKCERDIDDISRNIEYKKVEIENGKKEIQDCETSIKNARNKRYDDEKDISIKAQSLYEEYKAKSIDEYIEREMDSALYAKYKNLRTELVNCKNEEAKLEEVIWNQAQSMGITQHEYQQAQNAIRGKDAIETYAREFAHENVTAEIFKQKHDKKKLIFDSIGKLVSIDILLGIVLIWITVLYSFIIGGESRVSALVLSILSVILTVIYYKKRQKIIEKIENGEIEKNKYEIILGKIIRKILRNENSSTIGLKIAGFIIPILLGAVFFIVSYATIGALKFYYYFSGAGNPYNRVQEELYRSTLERLKQSEEKADQIIDKVDEIRGFVKVRHNEKLISLTNELQEISQKYNKEYEQLLKAFDDDNKEAYIASKTSEITQSVENQKTERDNYIEEIKKRIENLNIKNSDISSTIRELDRSIERRRKQLEEEISTAQNNCKKEIDRIENHIRTEKGKMISAIEKVERDIRESISYYSSLREETIRRSDEKIALCEKKYEDAFSLFFEKYDESGWKEICGFDYRRTWPIIHALATNILGWPVNATEMNVNEILELEILATGNASIAVEDVNFMPDHIAYGVKSVEFDDEDICKKIKQKLEGGITYRLAFFDEIDSSSLDEFGFRSAPTDFLYKVKIAEAGEKPIVFFYNFGDMSKENNPERCNLRNFVLRNTIFLPCRFMRKYNDCMSRCIITNESDRSEFLSIPLYSALRELHHLKESILSDGNKINNFMQEVSSDCEKNNENLSSFYEYALNKAERGRTRLFEHKYKIISVFNQDISKIKSLESVMSWAKSNRHGVYLMVFIDEYKLFHSDENLANEDEQISTIRNIVNQIKESGKVYTLKEKALGNGLDILEEYSDEVKERIMSVI